MFKINKKMMLCAAVGGDIEDYKAMIQTNFITLRCPHVERENNIVSSTIINLRQLYYDGELIGYAGRCERCGKIYYKGATS